MNFIYQLLSNPKLIISVVFTVVCIVSYIYGLIDLKKNPTNNPTKYIIIPLPFPVICICVSNFIKAYSTNQILINAFEIITYISFAAFVVTFVICAYLSYKRGYISKKKVDDLISKLVPLAIFMIACILALFILDKLG